jgi:hypothetical protein
MTYDFASSIACRNFGNPLLIGKKPSNSDTMIGGKDGKASLYAPKD